MHPEPQFVTQLPRQEAVHDEHPLQPVQLEPQPPVHPVPHPEEQAEPPQSPTQLLVPQPAAHFPAHEELQEPQQAPLHPSQPSHPLQELEHAPVHPTQVAAHVPAHCNPQVTRQAFEQSPVHELQPFPQAFRQVPAHPMHPLQEPVQFAH